MIKVKGGRVSVDNGHWYQRGYFSLFLQGPAPLLERDRTGNLRMESTAAQAQSAQHAFKDWIGDRLGTPLTSRIAYMECFPYSDVSAGWEMAGGAPS